MQVIPIQAIPSQTFSYIDSDNNQWSIAIKLVADQVAFSLSLNGQIILENITAVAGIRIIPYDYLEQGNFVLITQNQQIPDYTQFGTTQQLVFLSKSDILSFRQRLSDLTIITAADFDPNGGLPLRFAPQGYGLGVPTGPYITQTSENYVIEDNSASYTIEGP